MNGPTVPRRRAAVAFVLAAFAYLPALTAGPGRMPADSKLYLYLDPGRFLGDAATSFDPRQYLGWVPHQHVSYLWPAGPWFWAFETLGVPDWVAHRLWIGTLMVAAGAGVYWCARTLGLSRPAALVGALAYQLSPYVLPYVSRTSVMLLPWAGLGWIVGATVWATRRAEDPSWRVRWRDPAVIALVVATVGSVNATALAMIVPGPVLWLVHAVWLGEVRPVRAVAVAARTALLAGAASLWWIAMLVVQGSSGTDVLPYSESLADVSFTATSAEVWRQLGYWLFYVRDRFGPTTSASAHYLGSSVAVAISFAVPLLALASIAFVRWRHRRLAALLIATGVVLAVGVHPIDDRSPLMRALTGDADGGLALALRSSTRALPLAGLGIALALAAGVAALERRRLPVRAGRLDLGRLAGLLVTALVVVNLPALWQGGFVDPVIDRDQDPPEAWRAAAAALDDPTGRVLQVPGQEFGAFAWGYTVDHPLAGLADAPLATRDLLPLGSAPAMDLLFAFDDRIQDGTLEPAAIAPIARLLGARDVWLSNDAAYDRFDVTSPAVVRDWLTAAGGLGRPTGYGSPAPVATDVEMVDARSLGRPDRTAEVAPVELFPVLDAPGVARAASGTLVVSGNGDGLVDAAAAGLLRGGRAIVYSAAADDVAATLAAADGLLVTDSNRARARHWRSSQDTTGFTESAGRDGASPTELTAPATGDARLPVFPDAGPGAATTADQRGPVVARASAYGQPFALLPEHRPFMAVDGDPATAWTVAEHGDPIGATFDLTLTDPTRRPTALRAVQFTEFPDQRVIDRIRLDALDADGRLLGPLGTVAGLATDATIPLDLPAGTVTIRLTIEAVRGGVPFTEGIVAAVGFAELDLGLGPTSEVVRVPTDATDALDPDTPVAYLLTRLRTDPADRWRDDPEPRLVREFELPDPRTFRVDLTARLDRRADPDALAELLGWPVRASSHLLGRPEHAAPAAFDGDPDTAWITDFDAARGATVTIESLDEPVTELTVRQPAGDYSPVTELTLVAADGTAQTVGLVPGPDGAATVTVDPPLPAGPLTIELSGVTERTTIDRRFGDEFVLPAAISEISLPGLPALPDLSRPTALTDCTTVAEIGPARLAVAFTTAEPAADEPAWLGSAASQPLVALPCGEPGPAVLALPAGTHLVSAGTDHLPITVDRVLLTETRPGPWDTDRGAPAVDVVDHGRRARTLRVSGCADGCWVVLGEGHNTAWRARVVSGRPDGDLGAPALVDGGFTGWWVGPGDDEFTIRAEWTRQGVVGVAYAASTLAAAAAVGLVVLGHRRGPRRPAQRGPAPGLFEPEPVARPHVLTALWWLLAAGLLCGPWGLLWGALGALATVVLRSPRVPALVALASLFAVAGAVIVRARRVTPPLDGGWPHVFDDYHALGMFAAAALVVAALTADDGRREPHPDEPASLPSSP